MRPCSAASGKRDSRKASTSSCGRSSIAARKSSGPLPTEPSGSCRARRDPRNRSRFAYGRPRRSTLTPAPPARRDVLERVGIPRRLDDEVGRPRPVISVRRSVTVAGSRSRRGWRVRSIARRRGRGGQHLRGEVADRPAPTTTQRSGRPFDAAVRESPRTTTASGSTSTCRASSASPSTGCTCCEGMTSYSAYAPSWFRTPTSRLRSHAAVLPGARRAALAAAEDAAADDLVADGDVRDVSRRTRATTRSIRGRGRSDTSRARSCSSRAFPRAPRGRSRRRRRRRRGIRTSFGLTSGSGRWSSTASLRVPDHHRFVPPVEEQLVVLDRRVVVVDQPADVAARLPIAVSSSPRAPRAGLEATSPEPVRDSGGELARDGAAAVDVQLAARERLPVVAPLDLLPRLLVQVVHRGGRLVDDRPALVEPVLRPA